MPKVCPICGKKVAGKKALAQHRESVHTQPVAKPSQPSRVPTRAFRSARNINGRVNTSGHEVLKTIGVSSNTRAGTLLYTLMLSPKHMPRTRIHAESTLWTRWKPVSLRVTLVGSGSATTYGSALIGWISDPTYRISNNADAAIAQLGAMQVRQIVRVNGTVSLTLPTNITRKWLMTSGTSTDEDEYCHGSLHVIASADIGGFTGRMSFQVELDWAISWDGQVVGFADADPTLHFIRPDAGWSNIFTTSDGSYDSTILTFKMHHGGDMVPFTEAQDGVVYTVDGTSTMVYYYGSDGKKRTCRFFVRIRGYATPGLALCSTMDDAVAYYKSGDTSKLLKYYAAGDPTTPAIPTFAPVPATLSVEPTLGNVSTPTEVLSAIMIKLDAICARLDNVERTLFQECPGSESGSFENIGA